jgi:DNA-binding GntR family transcriptional regulator
VPSARRPHASLDPKASEPLYVQLARLLKDDIISGAFPVGAQLPTEEDFCKQFSVSRHTVREALRQLREENLVSSRKKAGTIVIPPRQSDIYVHDATSINDLLAFAAGARMEIKSIKMVMIDEKLAARTGLDAGDEWLVVGGIGHREGHDLPFCWSEYYIHRDYAAVGRVLQRYSGPIFPLIEDMFGLRVTDVHQKIAAVLISAALARDLKVNAATAALNVRQSFFLADGKTVQVAINTHPSSRFHHSMNMRRAKA